MLLDKRIEEIHLGPTLTGLRDEKYARIFRRSNRVSNFGPKAENRSATFARAYGIFWRNAKRNTKEKIF